MNCPDCKDSTVSTYSPFVDRDLFSEIIKHCDIESFFTCMQLSKFHNNIIHKEYDFKSIYATDEIDDTNFLTLKGRLKEKLRENYWYASLKSLYVRQCL